jgi:hypothetical protein
MPGGTILDHSTHKAQVQGFEYCSSLREKGNVWKKFYFGGQGNTTIREAPHFSIENMCKQKRRLAHFFARKFFEF